MNGIERNRAFDQSSADDPSKVSEAAAMELITLIKKIVDDIVAKRLEQEDVARFFTARVKNANITETTITDSEGNTVTTQANGYPVTVEYDDSEYETRCCSKDVVNAGDMVTVYTRDDISYYLLHLV